MKNNMRTVMLRWSCLTRRTESWSLLRMLCTSRVPSYYDDLGVHPQASSREIKAAFYTLSKQFHPDKNVGNSEAMVKFQTISEAYDVLGNSESRTKYDKGVLGRASSVAEREKATHRFEGEAFYESRRSGLMSKSRGAKELDEWVTNNRKIQFDNKMHTKKKRGPMMQQRMTAGGAGGGFGHNTRTDQGLGLGAKFIFVVIVILLLIVRGLS